MEWYAAETNGTPPDPEPPYWPMMVAAELSSPCKGYASAHKHVPASCSSNM